MNLYSIIKTHKMLMNWLKHEFLSFLLDNEPNELERDLFSASHASKERLFSAEKKFPMKNFLDLKQNYGFSILKNISR